MRLKSLISKNHSNRCGHKLTYHPFGGRSVRYSVFDQKNELETAQGELNEAANRDDRQFHFDLEEIHKLRYEGHQQGEDAQHEAVQQNQPFQHFANTENFLIELEERT